MLISQIAIIAKNFFCKSAILNFLWESSSFWLPGWLKSETGSQLDRNDVKVTETMKQSAWAWKLVLYCVLLTLLWSHTLDSQPNWLHFFFLICYPGPCILYCPVHNLSCRLLFIPSPNIYIPKLRLQLWRCLKWRKVYTKWNLGSLQRKWVQMAVNRNLT